MKENYGPFKLYTKQPNDIKFGSLYTLDVTLPLPYFSKRTIRVFLPEDFDENKKYPLLVMADGQNIVDKYTSAFGSWDIDKRQHELIQEGYPSFIVVGVDSPKGPIERAYEYSFPFIQIQDWKSGNYKDGPKLELFSHLLYEYIAKQLLPLIRKHFPISNDRSKIACGGSSMGGVFALSLISSYPEDFGIALCFSPGFFLYDQNEVKNYLDKCLPSFDKNHKIFLYTGDVGFEHQFIKDTLGMYDYLLDNRFNENARLLIDTEAEHHESYWSKHFPEAIRFWFS